MKAAYIHDATITNAKIANLAVDNAKIADLSVSKLTAGSIAVGQFIESTSYVANTSGWRINGNGTAEFSDTVVRGTVFATGGQIGGSTIDGTGMQSSNYAPGQAGWRISSNGSADFGSGVFRGTLAAANGSFTGSITGATGTFSGSLSGADITGSTGTFSGRLTAGTVDFSSSVGSTVIYTTPGTHTLTVPPGMTRMNAVLKGGGGGGGGGSTRSYIAYTYDSEGLVTSVTYVGGAGGGGGGGADSAVVVAVVPGSTFTLVIGVGGTGGATSDTPYSHAYPSAGQPTSITGILAAAGGAAGGILNTSRPNPDSQWLSFFGVNGSGLTGGAGSTQQGVPGGAGGSGSGGGGGHATAAYYSWHPQPSVGGNGGPGKAIIEFYDPAGVVLKESFEYLKAQLRNQGLTVT